jgi:hypothetical protein
MCYFMVRIKKNMVDTNGGSVLPNEGTISTITKVSKYEEYCIKDYVNDNLQQPKRIEKNRIVSQ